MELKELLLSLSEADGVGGGSTVLQIAENALASLGEVRRDPMGGLLCTIGSGTRRVLLDAHIDEIGFVVTAIDGAFLRVAACGGVDVRTLADQDVIVHGKQELFGVFSSLPPHLKKESEKAPKLEDMMIDCGLSHDRLTELVTPGDRVSFAVRPCDMLNGRLTGKSLDNRAGVAVVIDAARRLADLDDVTLLVSLSSQEEIGCRGAKTASFAADPSEAIVVDVSFGDGPDVPARSCGKLGFGPMIGVSPILDSAMTKSMIFTAQTQGIPFQLEAMGGTTGTNADPITISKSGVPTALVSIPLRNMHTACEVVELQDLIRTSDLIVAYVGEGGASRA